MGATREISEEREGPGDGVVWASEKYVQRTRGLGRVTLWELRRAGSIKSRRVGGKRLYNVPSVDDHIEKQPA